MSSAHFGLANGVSALFLAFRLLLTSLLTRQVSDRWTSLVMQG